MLVKIEARILIFPGTDFYFPSTSVPPGTFFTLCQGPDLRNIERQSCDNLTIMPKLRSTYDGRLIYKTSYDYRKINLLITPSTLHPFNCLFSQTTWVSPYQKGNASLARQEMMGF